MRSSFSLHQDLLASSPLLSTSSQTNWSSGLSLRIGFFWTRSWAPFTGSFMKSFWTLLLFLSWLSSLPPSHIATFSQKFNWIAVLLSVEDILVTQNLKRFDTLKLSDFNLLRNYQKTTTAIAKFSTSNQLASHKILLRSTLTDFPFFVLVLKTFLRTVLKVILARRKLVIN